MSVEDPNNLVLLTTGFHRRLHTNRYYTGVNLTVIKAARYGRSGVVYALRLIANDLAERDKAFNP